MSGPRPLHADVSVKTARLHLRPMRLDDAPDIFEARSDPIVMRWSTSKPETSISQTEEWIRVKILENATEVANYSVELLDSGQGRKKVIGAVGAVRGPEVGYAYTPAYHGKGYATEALQAFLKIYWDLVPRAPAVAADADAGAPTGDAAEPSPVASGKAADPRDVLAAKEDGDAEPVVTGEVSPMALMRGWDYAEAIIDPENKGSARVVIKCGFQLWSTRKDDFESVNTGTRSTAIYRLARPGTELGPPPGPFEVDMGPELS